MFLLQVLHKARHPRGKGAPHDQLLGELMRLPPPGKKGETVLDTCGGTWLTDLTWDKVKGGGASGKREGAFSSLQILLDGANSGCVCVGGGGVKV
jgi:hypothetical protein